MFRQEKIKNLIQGLAAQFITIESSNISLITVTNCHIFDKENKAVIYITVLPENKEKESLLFVKRLLGRMREYIASKMKTKSIPFLEVQIDIGEKNMRLIENL